MTTPNLANISAKKCIKCGKIKNLQYFYKTGAGKKYNSSACTECYNIARLERYAEKEAIGRRRTKLELNAELRQQVQDELDKGERLHRISKTCGISSHAIKRAVEAGILSVGQKEED